MIVIDGSSGEGGGQILRSSLTLSVMTGHPFQISNIRLQRSKPGLMAQHLQAVRAAAEISNAGVEDAFWGSTNLTFHPGAVQSGNYRFKIETAGSTSLVLQTILLPLSQAKSDSKVTISGGTHVAWSPCYHYLEWQWLPYLQKMGISARLTLNQAGFYPSGGGEITADIHPCAEFLPLNAVQRGRIVRIRGLSAVVNLDQSIARRQKLQALSRLEPLCRDVKIEIVSLSSPGKGTAIVLLAEFEDSQACYSALGAPDKRAEAVADEAVDELQAFLSPQAAIDQYLADQLILPLSFANGVSELYTSMITHHLITNAAVVQAFLPAKITIVGEAGGPGKVRITPASV